MSNLQIQEISLGNKHDTSGLKNLLLSAQLGTGPHYIDLSNFPAVEREDLVWKLQKIVEELKINLYFPYPCYLIMGRGNYFIHCSFPQLEALTQLPVFFTNRRASKKKELGLNAKISTISEKLSEMPLDEHRKQLHQKLHTQDMLFLYCQQYAHLQAIEKKRTKRTPYGR